MEGAKQQAANLLVKKEKVLELAAETFSSSEITPLLEKTTDESQVRALIKISASSFSWASSFSCSWAWAF